MRDFLTLMRFNIQQAAAIILPQTVYVAILSFKRLVQECAFSKFKPKPRPRPRVQKPTETETVTETNKMVQDSRFTRPRPAIQPGHPQHMMEPFDVGILELA